MQDLGPDMEDLLRRASEAYPLKQSEDRWNEIASRLSQKPASQPKSKSKPKQEQPLHKKYYSLLLLFGLLFSFLVLDYSQWQHTSRRQTTSLINNDDNNDVGKSVHKKPAVRASILKDKIERANVTPHVIADEIKVPSANTVYFDEQDDSRKTL